MDHTRRHKGILVWGWIIGPGGVALSMELEGMLHAS